MITLQSALEQGSDAADSVATVMGRLIESVTGADANEALLRNLMLSAVVVALIIFGRHLLLRVVDRRIDDVRSRYRWAKGSAYAAFVLVILFVVAIWFQWFGSLGTFLGLLTAGLAIALKDPVVDLAGWVFILWRRPFDIGDRVQIAGRAGDVMDIRLFQFSILEIGNWVDADQSTGRIIHIPNAKVFTDTMANYTAHFDYLWNEVGVLVTFESDWRKAKRILKEIADEHASGVSDEAERSLRKASRRVLIFYPTLTPIVYTSVKDSGVMLTLRYLCKPRARRGTSEVIWEAMLDRFAAEADIDLAYPTYRAFFNAVEGKDEARAPLPGSLGPVPPPDGSAPASRGMP